MLCLSFPYLYVGQDVATSTGGEEEDGKEGHEGMLTVCMVLRAAQKDAVGKGRCSLRSLCWHGCMLTFAGGWMLEENP